MDFVTNMFSIMSMNVVMILHGNLMMTTYRMLLPLIDEFIPKVTTIARLMLLYLFGLAQEPKCFIVLHKYVAENLVLIHDTPDSAEDFDSPICLACTTATICLACTTAKTITIFKMSLKSHKP